jgi:hypothetical protein
MICRPAREVLLVVEAVRDRRGLPHIELVGPSLNTWFTAKGDVGGVA